MFIPRKRPKPMKSAYKERSLPQLRRHIKTLGCSVKGCCNADIDPSHIRYGLPPTALKGGTSIKPEDRWIIPLCRAHHNELGNGEPSFYVRHKILACELSTALFETWQRETDAGRKWKRENPSSERETQPPQERTGAASDADHEAPGRISAPTTPRTA